MLGTTEETIVAHTYEPIVLYEDASYIEPITWRSDRSEFRGLHEILIPRDAIGHYICISANLYPLCNMSSLSLQNYERGHNPMLVEKPLDDAQFSTQQDLYCKLFEESSMESS